MFAPLINGSLFLLGLIFFGPGLFALAYWLLRLRDKDDPKLGARALLAYLEALTLQAALASAAFLIWVIVEYWAGRFTPAKGTTEPPPSGSWKGAIGTLLLHALLCALFGFLQRRLGSKEHPFARRFFRGFGAYVSSLLSLAALSYVSWGLFATTDGSTWSASLAVVLCYLPAAVVLSLLLVRQTKPL